MLFAIISSILGSISSIFWKRSLAMAPTLIPWCSSFVGMCGSGILISIVLLALGYGTYVGAITPLSIGLFVVFIGGIFINTPIEQAIYRREKLSALIPYERIGAILTIVIGFFLFHNVSVITFGIILVAVVVMVAFTVDWQHFTVPRSILGMLVLQSNGAFHSLSLGYFLLQVDSFSFYIAKQLVIAAILLVILLSIGMRAFRQIRELPRVYFAIRPVGSFIGGISDIIGLYLISSVGILIATLLGFLGIGVSVLLAYLLLGERPSRKDILLIVIVTSLVGLGMYCK